MRVVRYPDAGAFLDAAGPWLSGAEVENNVILGTARSVADGTRALKAPAYFAVACDGAAISACAMRTPPHVLVATGGSAAALAALAADAIEACDRLPGVHGPRAAAAAFADAWIGLAGGSAAIDKRMRLYRISRVEAGAPGAKGRLREVTAQERALAVQWGTAFAREAMPNDPVEAEANVDRYLKTASLYFWDDGAPVTICARSAVAGGAARISLVYTPPQFRRRGYATAAVTALTRRLLDGGAPYCCLYTDLANPTSNSIYARIGYQPVADFDEYVFST